MHRRVRYQKRGGHWMQVEPEEIRWQARVSTYGEKYKRNYLSGGLFDRMFHLESFDQLPLFDIQRQEVIVQVLLLFCFGSTDRLDLLTHRLDLVILLHEFLFVVLVHFGVLV